MAGLLDDFKAKNPAYADTPDDKLAEGLYKKFYADKMSRDDFNAKIGPPPLSFEDPPGMKRNPILPFAQELGEKRGPVEREELQGEIATPGFITSTVRGVESISQKVTGQRPTEFSRILTGDEFSALAAFAGLRAPGGALISAPAEEVATSVAGTAAKPLTPAAKEIVKRLQQGEKAGGATAQQIFDEMKKAPNKPLTLADLGPESVRALTGRAFRSGGEARNIIKESFEGRDTGAGERLAGDVSKHLATGSARQTANRLLQERSAAARPRYVEMEALQNIWSPRLQEFLDNPEVKKAMGLGFKLERMDALSEGRPFDPTQLGIDLDADGNVVFKKVPNMRVLDIAKQGLDAVIASERDDVTGRLSKTGRSYLKVREAYVKILDDLDTTGTYKRAREAWAGPSASLDALRAGRTLFRRSPEEIAEEFAKLSPGDKQFYRLGAADVIREQIEKTGLGSDEARAIIRNERNRKQLRPLFESDAKFDQFVNAVAAERTMFSTRRSVMGGSQTAERLQEDISPGTQATLHGAKATGELARGNYVRAGVDAFKAWNAMRAVNDPAVSSEVARILSSPLNEPGSAGLQFLSDYALGNPSAIEVSRPISPTP